MKQQFDADKIREAGSERIRFQQHLRECDDPQLNFRRIRNQQLWDEREARLRAQAVGKVVLK